jgi:hypothetical protein
MSRVIAPAILSSRFSYEPRTKTFIAEASDFTNGPNLLAQAFDDSCDAGFQIESVKSGTRVLFTFREVKKDDEGDVQEWVFDVYNPRNDPKFSGMTVVILND